MTPNMYDINSAMDGSQYIYSLQLGQLIKLMIGFSFAGGRMNYFTGGYKGFLILLKEGVA